MKATLFAYPASLRKGRDGRITVRFRDVPEALTDGADEAEAAENAVDALSEALMGRIIDREDIPVPSALRKGERLIMPDPTIAAKSALHQVARESSITAAELARRLGTDHKEARRILAPDHRTKLPRLAAALKATGHSVAIAVYPPKDVGRKASSGRVERSRKVSSKVSARRKTA